LTKYAEPTSALTRFSQLLTWLDKASFAAIVAAMALMALLVSVQVILRYLFSASIDSAAEISRLLFVWAIFLALPQGIARGIHVGIDALTSRMPKSVYHWIWRFTTALSLVLMLILAWLALDAIADKWQQMMPTINITASVYYFPLLICGLHGALHLLLLLCQDRPPAVQEIIE